MSLRNEQCNKVCRILDDVLANRPTERDSLISAVRKAFGALETEPQWIPCSERLPERIKSSYWICTETGYQCQCRWTNNIFGLGDGDIWAWKVLDIPQYSRVVAWMPLPEPYREEGDE